MNDDEFNSEWYRSEAKRKQARLEYLGYLVRTLYSERGEDPRTAELCQHMLKQLENEGA